MEDQKRDRESEQRVPEEVRFKYIGFDVYPKKVKKFWESEEEKRKYLEQMKQKSSGEALAERDHSLVRVEVFSRVDRMVLTLTSFLLTVSLFLPWFSVRGETYHSQILGVGYFLKLGTLFGYAPLGGPLFSVFVILVGLTILSSFGAGAISLAAIYRRSDDLERYLTGLKKRLKLNWIPVVLWVSVLFVSVISVPTPFADVFQVRGFGEGFNVISFFVLSSFGVWLTLPCAIVNCSKIGDL